MGKLKEGRYPLNDLICFGWGVLKGVILNLARVESKVKKLMICN